MRNFYFTFLVLLSIHSAFGQDDLLKMLDSENPTAPVPVLATFKSTRVITGQSIEQVAAKHLNLVILHRFGEVNMGAEGFWGLDQANMRLVLDYGITNWFQAGIARSSIGKTYDGNIKLKILRQAKGGMPISLGFYANTGLNSETWADPTRMNYFTSRLSFFNQIIVAKKFGDLLSLQIAPCFAHKNLVTYTTDQNTIFAIGTGASIRINRSLRINLEAYPRVNGREMKTAAGGDLFDYLGIGVDIETGGHVFQLMLSNGSGMLEQHMVRDNFTTWADGGMRLGFNISRTFSFDKKQPDKKW